MKTSIRPVRDSDLAVFWTHLSNSTAKDMAAVTRPYHDDREAFDMHWAKVLSDPAVLVRTVLADDVVAGHAAVYGPPDEREVTYWIDVAFWGRGVATAALAALIELVGTRPLYAHAVADNVGSIRVLEKCGFVVTGHGRTFARARGEEVDEVVLTLT
ncbi:GNAT family N-acetyltransferase [Prauserella muralis]|uniref:Acetyltransferase n=1 Tax=Prauserella muralis TaxID=588067 RepID=A0A2V4AMQ0_9PSEU|nr:GNAT family N-acetyltransferase [Prauserella muralis]PXY21472.1 acetyltransferase [Prauserella muralis]TWE30424.1 RimJ/RimL family protein N-acetyltransferase [Prauserella muralis]